MSGTCVIGLQWGDEAKGKLVDILSAQNDVVVRYQGGANAGHTVVVGDQTFKLHLIPSGILNPNVVSVISPGVVLSPSIVLAEIDSLTCRDVKVDDNLKMSDRLHVVFPWHIVEDKAAEEKTPDDEDEENIGTTLRGIGPCYRDKVGRRLAVRLGDMYRPDFKDQIARIVAVKNKQLGLNGDKALDAEAIYEEYTGYAEKLKPFVCDTTAMLLDVAEEGKDILFEGAQGALLDVDHGTYPYVTSSNSSGLGVAAGSGLPGRWVDNVIGVIKAYATRVGGGPFPTELENETGEHIRQLGNEFGTTTGRPRRCGWFDAVAARYTARLSGVDVLSLMMLDVLSELEEIQVCTAYELDGERITTFPSHVDDLRKVVPIYETLPGWQQDVTQVQNYEDLPENALAYIARISELLERPVGVVSVGPDRAQTIFANKSLSPATSAG